MHKVLVREVREEALARYLKHWVRAETCGWGIRVN